ncbi:asparagine synthase (glutamine-hydrolyzing) [Phenylobacterium immobile]|uniref:asparagine synthase (glutamine-hydrolyzing) n=1 Tax=Phenylobacterium immobile TaxID=21 RepID=UPI000A711B5A|nr:asparagine synthase (glutamine-hydrolyzing) [Phenylobacterium immobile]
MCGIAGFLTRPDAENSRVEAIVQTMIEALSHRGPDGVRIERTPAGVIAHARLSIIDLEGGWQPLHAAGATVVGNGEIYNYLELARDFGLETATGSDFEPLLHLYASEREAAFQRLRGMYAFCLIGADGCAWLARDPFGIKPLYYVRHDDGVAFASEPHALLAAGVIEPGLAEHGRSELLAFNYALQSPYPHIQRLEPGQMLEITAGRITGRRFQRAIEGGRPKRPVVRYRDKAVLLDQLDTVLDDAIAVHQRSDVAYGLFLSGGVDSSVIATVMARQNSRPVTAFTCGFDAPGAADERAQAERVATALDLDWRQTTFGEADFWRIAPLVAQALDDPTADYATLPTYRLAEAAKETLTVVLSGEGGDELFAGYGRYRRAMRPTWLGGRRSEPQTTDADALHRWRLRAIAPAGMDDLQRAQFADIATWLPDDLLLKLDRCLMAHGLEGRTPFLDPVVADFAFNLHDSHKIHGRFGKRVLRQWLERECPAAQPWARKQGFTVPVERWIAPRAADIAGRLSEVRALREAGITADAFAPGRRWPILFFALWSQIHLDGATPAQALETVTGTI